MKLKTLPKPHYRLDLSRGVYLTSPSGDYGPFPDVGAANRFAHAAELWRWAFEAAGVTMREEPRP